MNKEVLENQWTQAKELIREKFPNLSDDDIRQINGRFDQLIAKLQQRYGYSFEEAQEEVRKWNIGRPDMARPAGAGVKPTYASEKGPIRSDYRAEQEGSSFLRWLIPLAIAALLLSFYYGMTKTPETTTTPTATQERVIAPAQSDQALVQSIRQSLFSNAAFTSDIRNVNITSANNVVTLTGFVNSATDKNAIGNFVKDVPGVRSVNNQLEVRP